LDLDLNEGKMEVIFENQSGQIKEDDLNLRHYAIFCVSQPDRLRKSKTYFRQLAAGNNMLNSHRFPQ